MSLAPDDERGGGSGCVIAAIAVLAIVFFVGLFFGGAMFFWVGARAPAPVIAPVEKTEAISPAVQVEPRPLEPTE